MKTNIDGIRIYSIPDTVCKTENGNGVIKHIEIAFNYGNFKWYRFGVVLENNPFTYPIAYYPPEKVTLIDENSSCNDVMSYFEYTKNIPYPAGTYDIFDKNGVKVLSHVRCYEVWKYLKEHHKW